MTDDLAFVFNDPSPFPTRGISETAGSPSRSRPHEADRLPEDIDWMTLRQAHNETSIPISTLRKWAKKGKVRARLVRAEGRELRLVAFGDVVGRAHALERTIQPVPVEAVVDLRDTAAVLVDAAPAPAAPPVEGFIAPVAKIESASQAPQREPEREPAAEEVSVAPEGSILVPLDAWDRMLGQLGNLHEAGQQLAEARERAAKAETEAQFLKERLREMRKQVEESELALDLQSADSRLPQAPPAVEPVLQIGWRRFRDRWLSGK
ncbi:MAG: hypothetical protein HKN80_10335 [Acidimicrobiia bacterium]|nr:hypothetical protein [Acidimicrobiia bacterium]